MRKTRVPFDRAAPFYDKTRGLPELVMRQSVKTLIRELKGCKSILDAGVGTGRFAAPLQKRGFQVVGIDISRAMMEKAAEKDVDNLVHSDACLLPFKDSSFDATVCVHLLHLLADWQEALREICRVTREILVSMSYERYNPLREGYNRLVKSLGYESRRLGKGEGQLKDLVKPLKTVFVATYDVQADERLMHLSRRVYSSQWPIPKAINDEVVDELKLQFSGQSLPKELWIIVWRIKDVQVYFGNFAERR